VLIDLMEADMFDIHLENVGDVAVVQCEGRIVQSDAAFRLRDVIRSQLDSRVVVVDLSAVEEIEGGGLGMLAYLQQWAHAHNIKLKLFNPSTMVHDRLERAWMPQLDVASADEMIALLDRAESEQAA
jgi:anti-anti-sigma regulatory factor